MPRYAHQFTTTVSKIDYGRMVYHGLFLPESLLDELPEARKSRFRIRAEIAGIVLECGLMALKRRRYVLLSQAFLKQARLVPTQEVTVRFSPISSDHVEVPQELEQALSQNHRARRVWEKLSPGKRRGHAYRVGSAAQETTRHRRAMEVVETLIETHDP